MLARTAAAALTLSTLPQPAAAQASDPFTQALSESVLMLEQADDGTLSGEGFDRLLQEGREVQFFLIGEQHAAREIALAEGHLLRELQATGIEHFVVEIGPQSTREVEALIIAGTLRDYIRTPGQQFTFPFIFFEEELALVEDWSEGSPANGDALWGVDQEFVGAGNLLGDLLRRAAETDAQRAAAEVFAANSAANPMYLGTAPEAELGALDAAFADGSPWARDIVEGILLTHRVYGPFIRGSGPIYPANLERENFMKTNFVAHFNAAEERDGYPPRAVFKFGGNHLQRGFSRTDVPTLGNFVVEWGRARGFNAVNVMIDCFGGETFGIMQGGPVACENYFLEEGSPMFEALGDAPTALFDLRSLRPLLNRAGELDPRLRDLILSYDYYMVIRDVTPQTPVADLTLPDM